MFQKYFHCKIESNDFCSSNNNIDISDWKIKSKYPHFPFTQLKPKTYVQVQLDVLHKPEIEPEQVFIHTRDGEEVEVSPGNYPIIYCHHIHLRLSASSTPGPSPPGCSGSRTGRSWTPEWTWSPGEASDTPCSSRRLVSFTLTCNKWSPVREQGQNKDHK